MKYLLLIILLSVSALASGPGQPNDSNEYSQTVLIATPDKVEEKIYLDGKLFSKDEVKQRLKEFDERASKNFPNNTEDYPRFQVEYIVTLKIRKIARGSIASDTLTIKWRDLWGSMCPHIPSSAFSTEGIWYTGSYFKEGLHDHSVYWMPNISENLSAVLHRGKIK